jgi:hypothetical protein
MAIESKSTVPVRFKSELFKPPKPIDLIEYTRKSRHSHGMAGEIGRRRFGRETLLFLTSRKARIRPLRSKNQCRIEKEIYTSRERYSNDRMGESCTLEWRKKQRSQLLFSEPIPFGYVVRWVLAHGDGLAEILYLSQVTQKLFCIFEECSHAELAVGGGSFA